MKFHHIVEINDPLNPLIDPLSRAQLWQGLLMRAELPKLFIPHLDDCELHWPTADTLSRVLHYGALRIRDEVRFLPQEQVIFQVPEQGDIPASTLTMTIEEPQPGVLIVRFDYDSQDAGAESSMDAFYNSFRRSAYEEADIDTIRIIRQLAGQGRLDQLLF